MSATCRACGAPILWVTMLDPKKKREPRPHPVDPDPTEIGNVYVFHPHGDKTKLHARVIKAREEWPPHALPRTSHFATCPKAAQFRRKA